MAPGVMWTKEDCDKLNQLVERHGKKWTPIAAFLGAGKTGKQCRRQWERLNIVTKQCGWAPEEDALLLEFHSRYGNKWTRISRMIGGRTDNAVKNRYHALKLKRKAKYLTTVDSIDRAVGNRRLTNCSSLEERRAEKQQAERIKTEGRLVNEASDGGPFKSEAPHTTGYFCNFDGWPRGGFQPKSIWTQPDACKVQSSAAPYGVYAPGAMNDGPTPTYLMNLATDPVHIMAPSMGSDASNRMVDDTDSMESTTDNKIPVSAVQSESLSTMYDGRADLSSPFFVGNRSHPLPSCVLDIGHELGGFGDGQLISEFSSPKKPDLKLDLSFQHKADGFDFDSFLHSVSPMSPTAYLKFLNSLSPINRQTTSMSDNESHMKA